MFLNLCLVKVELILNFQQMLDFLICMIRYEQIKCSVTNIWKTKNGNTPNRNNFEMCPSFHNSCELLFNSKLLHCRECFQNKWLDSCFYDVLSGIVWRWHCQKMSWHGSSVYIAPHCVPLTGQVRLASRLTRGGGGRDMESC